MVSFLCGNILIIISFFCLIIIGPGEYDSQGSLGLGKGGQICCKDDRFKDHNRQVPGPGTYQVLIMMIVN